MKYIKLSPHEFLIEQEVAIPKKDSAKPQTSNMNNYLIYDESGSMFYDIKLLCSQMKKRIHELPIGDSVTLAWFSGEGGQYRYIVKGHRICGPDDYASLDKVIDQNCTTRGCTCFSEVLTDLNQVIDEVTSLSDLPNSLTFFTDGYPVVSNYSREISAISKAIAMVASKINSTLLVGYGHYYNKVLMASLAEQFGGTLIHSEGLADFSDRLGDFMTDARENDDRLPIKFGWDGVSRVFSLSGNQIVSYNAMNDGTLLYTPVKKGKNYLYFVSEVVPNGAKEFTLTERNLRKESFAKGAYALAYLLTQSTKTGSALEVLAKIGDVEIINAVTNSFTNTEYGEAEAKIRACVASPSSRFSNGFNQQYLPKNDAFCLKDAMDLLMGDTQAYFYPDHEAFNYHRIGRKTAAKAGYPEFKRSPNCKSPLTDLVYHESRLNLSLRARIKGTVELDDQSEKFNFTHNYNTFVWRNYTLVKDGVVNVKTLPISMGEETFKALQASKMIPEGITWLQGNVYPVDLSAVPVMNRKIAEGSTSAKALAADALRELELKARQKVVSYFKKKAEASIDSGPDTSSILSAEQEEYLTKFGITPNGFNPPMETMAAEDFYEAPEFDIKIKGFSSFPKVQDVQTLLEKGSKLTRPAALLKGAIDECLTLESKFSGAVLITTYEGLIKEIQIELREVRGRIQATKFALLLGKKWFDEFSSRDEATLTLGDKEVTFALRTKRVEY